MDAVDRSQLELLSVQLNGKLDRLSDKVDAVVKSQDFFAADHEKRVRSLEKWKFALPASAVLVIAAFLGGKAG